MISLMPGFVRPINIERQDPAQSHSMGFLISQYNYYRKN